MTPRQGRQGKAKDRVNGTGRKAGRARRGWGAAAGERRLTAPRPELESAADSGASEAEQEQAAQTIALRQLAAQPRARAELAQTLKRRGVAPEVAERVLDRLAEVGLINDAAFANAWVETRHVGRGLSRRALAHELRHRGVDTAKITDAVDQLDSETELATARAVVERKLRATRGLETQVRIRRAAGQLARKGYPAAVALRVVREALEDERATDSGDLVGSEADLSIEDIDAALASDLSDDELA